MWRLRVTKGVNLGFFAANVCFYRIHFDAGERVFAVDKLDNADLWRGSTINNPEISMIGVEYVFNSLDGDMTIPTPVPSHWSYDFTGLQSGSILLGLLGYEVDGCWDGSPPDGTLPTSCPITNVTIRLAASVFIYGTNLGHSYMTIYTNASGAQVFATGSMQWN